jgi:hypothetical protein
MFSSGQARDLHAQMQAHPHQHFLDFVDPHSTAVFGGTSAVPPQRLRQLGEVRRHAAGLVLAEQLIDGR